MSEQVEFKDYTAEEFQRLFGDTATTVGPLVSGTNIQSASELLSRQFPEPKYAVHGILSEGVTILAGKPKLGKSWCSLGMSVAVASGGRVFGHLPVTQGDVLHIALEDGPRRLQKRLRKMLGKGPTPQRLYCATEWRKADDGGIEDVRQWLQEHPEARLVVIDTLKRIRPVERSLRRMYDNDYDAVAPLSGLALEHGVSILIVHHTRKADSEDPLELISGSFGLTGSADGVLVLKRSRGQADAELHAMGRDFEDTQLALQWDADICSWKALGDLEEYRLSKERRQVIDLLRKDNTSMMPKEIAEALNRSQGSTRKLLCDMAADGLLHNDGSGHYAVVESNGNSGNTGNTPLFEGALATTVTAVTTEDEDEMEYPF